MKDNYVLSHNFGYGCDEAPIIKLKLRNFKDCEIYVKDIMAHTFVAKLHKNTLQFYSNSEKVKVSISKLK